LPLADAAPPRACRFADPGADADAAIPSSSDRPPHQPGTSAAAASRSYRSTSRIGSARGRRCSDPARARAAGRVVGAGG
jgi:hypothetical protein